MIEPGKIWNDTDGFAIQAHGGGVLYSEGVYYWYGENKDAPNCEQVDTRLERVDVIGVSCYSSRNLVDWRNEGLALSAVLGESDHDLGPDRVVERPKVIYNRNTGLYVMWLHVDSPDYTYARTGRAVSTSPTGPFTYLGSISPAGHDSRDMTVYCDKDGSAYLIFSSDWNKTLRIVQLTDDYLHLTGDVSTAFENQYREAPALFRRKNTYYMITSACTGWAPNEAKWATAPSPLGPWTLYSNPFFGFNADHTFGGQDTFVLPLVEQEDAFICMLDLWNPTELRNSRYAWLPIAWNDCCPSIEWKSCWDMSVFDQKAF